MDVIFKEDESRIRKGNAPAIMTAILHLCMNLFVNKNPLHCACHKSAARRPGTTTTALRLCSGDDIYAPALGR
jgi:hypothetical protein